jgi:hypothetical protein
MHHHTLAESQGQEEGAKMKRLLVIEIDPDEKTVRITNGDGQETLLESVIVLGGDTTNERLFIQAYGASSDAAWAFGQGLKIALQPENIESALNNFYKQAALHCATICAVVEQDQLPN